MDTVRHDGAKDMFTLHTYGAYKEPQGERKRLIVLHRVIDPFTTPTQRNVAWTKAIPYCGWGHAGARPRSKTVRIFSCQSWSSQSGFSHISPPCFRGRSITTVPLLDFAQRHVTKGVNHLTEDVFVKGDGSWVTMHSGRKLLDFTSGIGVTNLGASGGMFSHRSTPTRKNHHPRPLPSQSEQSCGGPMPQSRARAGSYPRAHPPSFTLS